MEVTNLLLWLHYVVMFLAYLGAVGAFSWAVAKLLFLAALQVETLLIQFANTKRLFWAVVEAYQAQKGR